ncbi:MAG: hypothetical protein HQL26_05535 [Candidatus Omnitrophica bacterium]|nr:hypothetical protein [Candidatus Omnitrophota bacterium]
MIISLGILFIVIGFGMMPLFLVELGSSLGRSNGVVGLIFGFFIIVTGIFLLLKKNWARISAQVILALFAFLGVSITAFLFFPSQFHHSTKPMTLDLIVCTVIFSLLEIGLPLWGIIVLRRDDTKKFFSSKEPLSASNMHVAIVSDKTEINLDFLENDQIGKMCRSLFVFQDDGKLVFSLGPFRRAYIIDSTATAERLYKRYALYYHWFFAVTLFVIVLLGSKILATPKIFIGFMGGMLLFQNVLLMMVFSLDLSRLVKVEKKNPLGMWLTGMRQGRSRKDILIRLGGSIACVLGSVWMMKTITGSEVIAWSSIIIFTVAALVWLIVLLTGKKE